MNALTCFLPAPSMRIPAFALFATTFVWQFVGMSYAAFQIETPPLISLLQPLGLLWAVCFWFEAEIKRANKHLPMDAGLLLYVAWFIWIPIYLIKTRGVSGLWGIAGFIATVFAAWAATSLFIFFVWYD